MCGFGKRFAVMLFKLGSGAHNIAIRRKDAFGYEERDDYRRPANEDDDGYDPYSDRPADEPEYEEDPWR